MSLYRLNLHLSQEVFTLLSCFEVALRNAIDRELTSRFGENWLRDSVLAGGIFDIASCRDSARIITKAFNRLSRNGEYTHHKLLAETHIGNHRNKPDIPMVLNEDADYNGNKEAAKTYLNNFLAQYMYYMMANTISQDSTEGLSNHLQGK